MMAEAAAGGAAPYYASPSGDVVLHRGDARAVLRALPVGSMHVCICSPPYWNLRDYQTATWEGGDPECGHGVRVSGGPKQTPGVGQNGHAAAADRLNRAVCGTCGARRVDAQIGLEESPDAYVAALVAVFREVWRVLRDDGTLWLNLGDSYAAHGRMVTDAPPHKDLAAASARYKNGPSVGRVAGFPRKGLMMIPSRVAIALQEDGWLLRSMIPWLKRNAMPDSATDRPGVSTEYVFLLSKAERYFYDAEAVRHGVGGGTHSRGTKQSPPKSLQHEDSSAKVKNNRSFMEATWGPVSARNRRNADWWFDSLCAILAGATGLLADEDGAPLALPVNPAAYPGAHFATFSPKLVEPMVLASTSARGVCPACLAPWVRVTERGALVYGDGHTRPNRRVKVDAADCDAWARPDGLGATQVPGAYYATGTTGWRAGCGCENAGDPIPAVVLDPFAGACTTGVVARKHGRHFVGIDLSEPYLEMGRERLGQLALPLMGG